MMQKRKWIYPIIIVLVAIGILGYNYVFQDHRDIKTEKVAFTLSADELATSFQNEEEAARLKYENKTIAVSGELTSIDGTSLILDNKVFFALSENETPPTTNKLNTTISLKGRCLGYDSLLEEVNLDQASLIK